MTLAARLSSFFLAALATVLVGFSVALYVLARQHLERQVDERLNAALGTLAAAAEIGPAGVEWEPDERALGLGQDSGVDQIRWVVWTDRGKLLDRSPNLNLQRLVPEAPSQRVDGKIIGRDGRSWRLRTRLLSGASWERSAEQDAGGTARESGHHALVLAAYAPLEPTQTMLRSLALTLAALSVVIWMVAAIAGRRLCRRALEPVAQMASAARESDAAEPGYHLPLSGTHDELEDLGQAFNGLLDRLHEALERQRRFAGHASHQLRTPLTGLLGQVDVALRRERSADEYRRVLEVVRSKGTHLRQIVESLLFLARPDVEADCPSPEVIDLAAWLPGHLQSWSAHPRASDLNLVQDDADALPVRVHPTLLAQMLDNLIDNACKYSAPGTPVALRMRRDGDEIVLSVEDQGGGLSPEEIEQVFEPFYRSPQTRHRAGVGLGLAVARRIAAAFGGSIRAESQPGAGARFEIRLPAAGCADSATPTESRAILHQARGGSYRSNPETSAPDTGPRASAGSA